ncbi:hypothetical protein [Mucilaginibacter sp.]|uniref:hypothetical protein n=1 Tax=Mucilaginibacter sp. TaxID=1882438 RepID=UPI0025EBE1EB|nr:hypothetical protein [Mucilaginibacter sp.]
MGIIKLDKENLTDLAITLSGVSAYSDTFFDLVRKSLSDIGDKIQTDNCGTVRLKKQQFDDCLQGLVSASALPDVADTLSAAIVTVTKKL